MRKERTWKGLSPAEWALIAFVLLVCAIGAALVPTDQCPDETGRMQLVHWMVDTGTLPTGNEEPTIMEVWGFSYALRPFLPQIVSAAFVSVASLFTRSYASLLFVARLPSVFSVVLCCALLLGLGHRIFDRRESAVLFAAIVCLLPQVVFLGMYVNNDAPSLAVVTGMLYAMVRAYDEGWRIVDCLWLAVATSACLLTYYVVYGWIVAALVFCVVGVLSCADVQNRMGLLGRRLALVVGVCALLAGWFFVRNAWLHDGDVFGLVSEARSRERMAAQGVELYQPIVPRDEGVSFLGLFSFREGSMLWMSARSFVGTFGYMIYYLPLVCYGLYYAVFVEGLALYGSVIVRERPSRRHILLVLTMLLAVSITVFMHLWASWTRDFEPQGRYVITLILLLGYLLAYGVDRTSLQLKEGTRIPVAGMITVGWIILFAQAYLGTMSQMLA